MNKLKCLKCNTDIVKPIEGRLKCFHCGEINTITIHYHKEFKMKNLINMKEYKQVNSIYYRKDGAHIREKIVDGVTVYTKENVIKEGSKITKISIDLTKEEFLSEISGLKPRETRVEYLDITKPIGIIYVLKGNSLEKVFRVLTKAKEDLDKYSIPKIIEGSLEGRQNCV